MTTTQTHPIDEALGDRIAARGDWQLGANDELARELERLEGSEELTSLELARHWIDAGLSAHASIAANARLALQLMSLGAPPQLLAAAAQAMQDETLHAQACFSLARRYSGQDWGPGPLEPAAPPLDADVATIVLDSVKSGCIGHAVDALCAREALEHCQDAATREVLIRLQENKAQQAQLAWRFLAWALRGARSELVDRVRVVFLAELEAKAPPLALSARDRHLLRHGVLGKDQRFAIEQRVLREVVLPSMDALLPRRDLAAHV
jgi:hypothetical protein